MTTTIRQVQNPVDPSMKDLLDLFRKDLLQNLNCHHVGTIQSFDAENQLATATINYSQTYFNYNDATGAYTPYSVSYPILINCPVICLGGGSASLTFPIAPGDECLIIFNDRDLTNWLTGQSGAQVATPRLHSFSDGIILVGMRSLANVLDDYDTTNAVLKNGTTKVAVGPLTIGISNGTTTLNTLLQSLMTNLGTLCTNLETMIGQIVPSTGMSSANIASNIAAIQAVGTSLSTLASQIGGLLT